jgi:hypothetical protein
MERPTPMKTEQAINGLYPDADDDQDQSTTNTILHEAQMRCYQIF